MRVDEGNTLDMSAEGRIVGNACQFPNAAERHVDGNVAIEGSTKHVVAGKVSACHPQVKGVLDFVARKG